MSRVLFITANDWVPWGGSEVLWYELAKKCIRQGHSIGISISNWNPTPHHIIDLKTLGACIYYKETYSSHLYHRLTRRLSSVFRKNYETRLFEFRPDIVIISQGSNKDGVHWMEWCRRYGYSYVTIVQSADESYWPGKQLSERMKIGYENSLVNYFVSKSNLRTTQLQTASDLNVSEIIYNPFNVSYSNNTVYPDNGEWFILANVARYEFQAKGQDILLEVLNEKKWRERNVFVNFYGSGLHTDQLISLIKYFDIVNCEVKGYVDTTSIWKRNQALVLPSRYEGLPLALVEAMLSSRFGIVTNVSGNPEVVIDNDNGFIAVAPKPEYLDEAMERAWNRRVEWETIGKRARLFIRERVPEEPIDFLYEKIYSFISDVEYAKE